jgi:hypothetical protein
MSPLRRPKTSCPQLQSEREPQFQFLCKVLPTTKIQADRSPFVLRLPLGRHKSIDTNEVSTTLCHSTPRTQQFTRFMETRPRLRVFVLPNYGNSTPTSTSTFVFLFASMELKGYCIVGEYCNRQYLFRHVSFDPRITFAFIKGNADDSFHRLQKTLTRIIEATKLSMHSGRELLKSNSILSAFSPIHSASSQGPTTPMPPQQT